MGELAEELWRVLGQVDVQEAVVLLGRDVVESLQGLHGVGRRDLLEEGLQLLLGPQAPDAVELRLGADDGGDGGQFLRADPARYILMTTPGEERIENVLALIMEHRGVVGEIVHYD